MAKAEGEKDSYYRKIKEENEKLKKKVEWLDNDSFLLDSEADKRQVYHYMKKNPESAKFIFKKYKNLQPMIREVCDPENPLYIDGVKKALEGIIEINDAEEDLERLKEEATKERKEIELLEKELKDAEKEYDEKQENLKVIKREYEEAMKQRANIRTDRGMELIEKNVNDVTKFLTAILEKWDNYFHQNPISLGMTLDKAEFNHMELLNQNLKEMIERIHTEDFLSPENLDTYHKELLEKVQKEKENALNEMNAVMAYNPKKVLTKALDDLENALYRIESGQDDSVGGRYLNNVTVKLIRGDVGEAMDFLDHLKDQVENKDRRSKS
ncbi:hypothetical protein [Thermoplasma acidophilum]|uniref:Uncharacterized protein n=1 Tax=Thermoplasma acidophilum (strain ATCC 25905 / DSM 1728 / JCM 9062 / NBRC 15155 / AMRC-C165) TaxID=273075 RepID=Q9HJY4_THEAC|nr:hypothetical protein [Thermoplasma acidophilum]CAC11956.1 hypothetical protein [Thermoplasma acidophilum]